MKRLLFLCLWLSVFCVRAAVPTFQSFEPTQFLTNNNRVAYIATHTNDAGIIYPALVNSLTLTTNENVYGTFSLPAKVTLLTLGTNYLDVSTNSTWLLNSPTNDATQVILSLSAGAYQGQLLFITSQNGGNSFTLPDLSEQWDVPGAYVDIQGDWVGTTNRGAIFQYAAPDWLEMARFDPSQTGGGTISGSGTAPFLPYWSSPTTLSDSTLQQQSPTNLASVQNLGIGTGGATLSDGATSPFLLLSSFNLEPTLDPGATDRVPLSYDFLHSKLVYWDYIRGIWQDSESFVPSTLSGVSTNVVFDLAYGGMYFDVTTIGAGINVTTTNRRQGRDFIVRMTCSSGGPFSLTFPAWNWQTVVPTTISAGDTVLLHLWFYTGSAETDVVAQWVTSGAITLKGITKAQKTAITSPQNGMVVYQTDNTPGFRGYVGGTWFIFSMAADP